MIYGRSAHDLRWKKKKDDKTWCKARKCRKMHFFFAIGGGNKVNKNKRRHDTEFLRRFDHDSSTASRKKRHYFFRIWDRRASGCDKSRDKKMPLRGASLPFEVRTEPPTPKEINLMCAIRYITFIFLTRRE